MSAFALITGALHKPPERRTSKAGKPFIVATLRVVDGNASEYWTLFVFAADAQADFMRLTTGDKISAQGRLQVETYAGRDGSARISRTLLADHVLALRQPKRRREAEPAEGPNNFEGAWEGPR